VQYCLVYITILKLLTCTYTVLQVSCIFTVVKTMLCIFHEINRNYLAILSFAQIRKQTLPFNFFLLFSFVISFEKYLFLIRYSTFCAKKINDNLFRPGVKRSGYG